MKRFKPKDNAYKGVYTHTAKDGTVTWYVAYNGRPPEKVPGNNITGMDARNYRSECVNHAGIDMVIPNRRGKVSPEGIAFLSAYKIWLEWAEDNLAPKTRRPMVTRWEKYLKGPLARIALETLDEPFVRGLVRRWKRMGLSAGSQKRITAVISSIYKACKDEGYYTGANPIYGMTISGARARRERTLTPQECDALLLEFKKTRRNYYWMMGLQCYGGLRPSEVLKLRPMDIHMSQGKIVIPNVKTPTGATKSRTVWFGDDPKLKSIVSEIVKGFPRRSSARLFPNYMDYPYINRIIDKLGLNDGIDPKDHVNRISPYSFRHSYASEMLEQGANVTQVQAALGHDRLDSTMVYLHNKDDAAREGQRILAEGREAQENSSLKVISGGKY
ncbi:MAG: tyrosine-type recombinase/integrase [Planctomycetota bacterium]|jgi:integrase